MNETGELDILRDLYKDKTLRNADSFTVSRERYKRLREREIA